MTEPIQGKVCIEGSSVKTSQTGLEYASALLTNWSVICVGAVAPAAWTYARLQRLLHEEARLILKDLEGYAEPLAADYRLYSEVKAITHVADVAGFLRASTWLDTPQVEVLP